MTESTASAPDEHEGLTPYHGWGQSDHQNADLKIISSDNRAFWVSSTQLVHHSSVFRSMVSACGSASDTLYLTDTEIEESGHLYSVLEIMTDIDKGDSDAKPNTVLADYLSVEVVLLAKKYDMKSVISEIKLFLFSLIAQWPSTGGQFVLEAAHLGDWTLCGRLIATLDLFDINDPYDVMRMRRTMDWRGWTPDIMNELGRVSAKFAWAVCHAGTIHAGRNREETISYEGMGKEIARLMTSDVDYEEQVDARWTAGPLSWWGV